MTATLWIALGVIVAALVAREVKISEFRQAWIDGLRADISEYITKSHEWIEYYQKFNQENNQAKKNAMLPQIEQLSYASLHVLRRIELRFKPDDKVANTLIEKLKDLLDPSKIPPPNSQKRWSELADKAVTDAKTLLKEEWEITKNPLRKLRSLWRAP